MRHIKKINIKNRTYYFVGNMINIADFDPNLLKSCKNIDAYYIGDTTKKDSDYLIIDKVNGYFQEKNGNGYLIFYSSNKNKGDLIKCPKLWDRIKNSIEKVNNKLREYGKDFLKIKFTSVDNLPSNKTPKVHNMVITIRFVFNPNLGGLYRSSF